MVQHKLLSSFVIAAISICQLGKGAEGQSCQDYVSALFDAKEFKPFVLHLFLLNTFSLLNPNSKQKQNALYKSSSQVSAEEGDYWTEVSKCSGCLGTSGCGYCLSTLTCLDGTADGPSDGSPCPNWLSEPNSCPVIPTCNVFTNCGDCAGAADCAWCSSQNTCMTISDVYSHDCTGTVFDAPCPVSYVTDNTVVGNLIVVADNQFGGGEVSFQGPCTDCNADGTFALALDATEVRFTMVVFVSPPFCANLLSFLCRATQPPLNPVFC